MAIFLGSSNFNGYNGSHFTASVYLDRYSQDINANKTDYTLHLYAGSIDGYSGSGSASQGYIQGVNTGSTTSFPARTQVDMGTYSGSITHNADGTAYLDVSASVVTNWSGVGSASINTGWTPPTIPRSASVTATDANIEEKSKITINRLTNSFNYTLRYFIIDEAGKEHMGIIASGINQDVYEWSVPSRFYKYWTTGNIKNCIIYCDTFNGESFLETKQTSIKISVGVKTVPLIDSDSFNDRNSTTVALTGDNSTMIQGYSAGRLSFSATLGYYAKVSSVLDENQQPVEYQIVSDTEQTQVISVEKEYNDFKSLHTIYVFDGRGMAGIIAIRTKDMPTLPTSVKTITYTRIDYIPLTLNVTAKRPSATTGEIAVTFSGNYFNDSFGDVDNTLELSWKYREKGVEAWTDGGNFTKDTDYTITENTYESKGAISLGNNFDYRNIYEIAIYYKDKLIDAYTNKIVTRGLPIFWWNKDGVYDGNNKKFLVEGEASGGDTLPIGAIVDYDGTTVPEGYEEVTNMTISDGGNAWKKVDFGTYRLYWKYVTYTYTYTANGWGEISFNGTYNKLPSGITFNKDKMIFNGTASCGDHAIEQSVGIYNNNATFWVGWQNKYSGDINNATTVLNVILIDFS